MFVVVVFVVVIVFVIDVAVVVVNEDGNDGEMSSKNELHLWL